MNLELFAGQLLDWVALINFCIVWFGYYFFSESYSKQAHPSLSLAMNEYRRNWVAKSLTNGNQIADVQMISVHERNCVFLASSCLLVLASVVSLLWNIDSILDFSNLMAADVIIFDNSSTSVYLGKLLLLCAVLAHGFFSFTWSLRQFNMFGLMLVSAPDINTFPTPAREQFIDQIAALQIRAGIAYAHGFRSMYFSLALLSWLVGSIVLIVTTYIVLYVLFRREFRSKALKSLHGGSVALQARMDSQ